MKIGEVSPKRMASFARNDRSFTISLMNWLLLIGALSIPLLGEDGILEHTRQVNLERAAHMPNFIADEVITGFGRTGAWFGVDHEGLVPDLMTVAKGLTSGYVPAGAVVLREPLARALEKRYLPLGGTFSGHPLACAAALACLAEYEERGLIENARRLGVVLLQRLH